jgi:hypothetical protein
MIKPCWGEESSHGVWSPRGAARFAPPGAGLARRDEHRPGDQTAEYGRDGRCLVVDDETAAGRRPFGDDGDGAGDVGLREVGDDAFP